jgi:hypothetical protein
MTAAVVASCYGFNGSLRLLWTMTVFGHNGWLQGCGYKSFDDIDGLLRPMALMTSNVPSATMAGCKVRL